MDTDTFQKQYANLNPSQKKAVDTIEGPVMVIAGPGTGKTQILILRIANILLKTQVNPENILALTFTESAVSEMRKRLVQLIGSPAYRVEINTFHGFCNDIIKRFPDYFQELIAAESITEIEQVQIIEEILTTHNFTIMKPLGDLLYYTHPLLSAINELKKEGVTPGFFTQAIETWHDDFQKKEDLYHEKGAHKGKLKSIYITMQKQIAKNREVAKVYELYQKSLTQKKVYDFNDMILSVIAALKTYPELLLQLQEQYQYILVDEHQDTNTAQNTLLESLSGFYSNPNLFVVGDEKQAIFRFQGASLENFLYFQKLYPHAMLVTLTENYRSSQTILDSAISMMAKNNTLPGPLGRNVKLLAKQHHDEKKITLAQLTTYESEFAYVTQDIQKRIASGLIPQDIAVLVRKNRDITPLTNYCDLFHIPYVIEADEDILTDYAVNELIHILRAIDTIGSDVQLIRVMHCRFFNVYPMDIYRLMQYAKEQKITVWEVLTKPGEFSLTLTNPDAVYHLTTLLQTWQQDSFVLPFDQFVKKVLQESFLLPSLLKEQTGLIHLENLKRLFQEIHVQSMRHEQFTLTTFLTYLDMLKAHNLKIHHIPPVYKNGIRIMTVHKSKGLEFAYVYILQAFEGHWGNARKPSRGITLPWDYLTSSLSLPTKDDVYEDERRLFFVALTRAKKHITISYATHAIDGKEQIPCSFISEIDETFLEHASTDAFEKKFLENPVLPITPSPSLTSEEKKAVYLENKAFFAELFQKKGLSVSALDNYLHCPWRYFFRNLLEIPDVPSEKAIYGRLIHQTLSEFFKQPKEKQTKQFLLATLEKLTQILSVDTLIKTRFIADGEKALSGFFDQTIPEIHVPALSELAINGIIYDKDIILTGRLDLLEKKTDSTYVVHDFKTSKPLSRNASSGSIGEKNYKRQLLFYKLLLDRYKNGQYQTHSGIIDFVEPDERGHYKSEIFTLEKQELQELGELIKKTAHEIRNLLFWNDGCKEADCEYCQLRSSLSAFT